MQSANTLSEPPKWLVLSHGQVVLQFDRIVPADGRPGIVPYYHFRILTAEGLDVGRINLRVGESEHVTVIVGHVGYEIFEAHRGHGYARQACRAIAPLVRTFYSSVIITSDPENAASVRTIEKLGAVFLEEVPVPPDDPHYARGSRRKRRYEWAV
jgi:tagatose 1,6-diphosphate aldolase